VTLGPPSRTSATLRLISEFVSVRWPNAFSRRVGSQNRTRPSVEVWQVDVREQGPRHQR